MPYVAPLIPRCGAAPRAAAAALSLLAALPGMDGAALAADPVPAAVSPSAAAMRELELTRAFVYAHALSQEQVGGDNRVLAQLLLSTERRYQRQREGFIAALDAFRLLNARCEALEEAAMGAASHDPVAMQSEQCVAQRRGAAARVSTFPRREPAYLQAMKDLDAVAARCAALEQEARRSGASDEADTAWRRCEYSLDRARDRALRSYPNYDWIQQLTP